MPHALRQTEPAPSGAGEIARSMGLADIAGRVFRREDLDPLWSALHTRATAETPDFGAAFDLANLLQLVGRGEDGLTLLHEILGHARRFRHAHGDGSGLLVLALMVEGDFMANTPIDFLLDGSDMVLDVLFLEKDGSLPATLPDHDVAIVAIGESDAATTVLEALDRASRAWPRPTINANTDGVLAMRRDLAAGLLAREPSLLAPATARAERAELARAAAGGGEIAELLDGTGFPIIVRPVGSHAGGGLERIEDAAALGAYLAGQPGEAFYVAPFIDYSGPDGLFRKYRIVFVEGRPFLAHMAISQHWMVHYLNAGMLDDAAKRDEEGRAMASFDAEFAMRHARAFEVLSERFGLDYFGVDCAETQDGRLLVFEADNALIVHDMDPPEVFPYKSATMRRLFAAFQDMLARRASRR